MENISLGIIDSYPLVREAFSLALTAMGFEIGIQAGNFPDFLEQSLQRVIPVNACLIDMTSISDKAIALQIKRTYPEMKVIAYTLHEAANQDFQSIDLFLDGASSQTVLREMIEQVLSRNRMDSS